MSPDAFDADGDADKVHSVTLKSDPVLLDGESELFFSLTHNFRVHRPPGARAWRVSTAAYEYGITDADGREVFLYHWHPDAPNSARYPHLHMEAGAVSSDSLRRGGMSANHNALRPEIQNCHFPTRRIALEDVLRMLAVTRRTSDLW